MRRFHPAPGPPAPAPGALPAGAAQGARALEFRSSRCARVRTEERRLLVAQINMIVANVVKGYCTVGLI